jgi:hypothetical protein
MWRVDNGGLVVLVRSGRAEISFVPTVPRVPKGVPKELGQIPKVVGSVGGWSWRLEGERGGRR